MLHILLMLSAYKHIYILLCAHSKRVATSSKESFDCAEEKQYATIRVGTAGQALCERLSSTYAYPPVGLVSFFKKKPTLFGHREMLYCTKKPYREYSRTGYVRTRFGFI